MDNQQNHVLITKLLVEKSLKESAKLGLLNEVREANDPEMPRDSDPKSYDNIKVLIVDDNFFCSIAVVNLLQQY